jgi:hypothetical protein
MEVIFLSRGQEDCGFAMSGIGDPASASVRISEESDLPRSQRRGALSVYRDILTH